LLEGTGAGEFLTHYQLFDYTIMEKNKELGKGYVVIPKGSMWKVVCAPQMAVKQSLCGVYAIYDSAHWRSNHHQWNSAERFEMFHGPMKMAIEETRGLFDRAVEKRVDQIMKKVNDKLKVLERNAEQDKDATSEVLDAQLKRKVELDNGIEKLLLMLPCGATL